MLASKHHTFFFSQSFHICGLVESVNLWVFADNPERNIFLQSVHNIQSFKHGKNFRGQFNKWNYSQTSDWQTASCIQKLWTREWSCVHCRNGKVRWKSNLEVDKVSGGCRQPLESPTTPNVILANHLLAASNKKTILIRIVENLKWHIHFQN